LFYDHYENTYHQEVLSTLFFLGFIQINFVFCQQDKILTIPWSKPVEVNRNGQSVILPNIEGQAYNGNRPNFFWREKMTSNAALEIALEIKSTSPASLVEINYLNKQNIEVGEPEYLITISNAASERHAVLNMLPFMKVGGQIHRIIEVEVKFSKGIYIPNAIKKDFVSNSVLQSGSGVWIKIAVTQDGVHKIHRDFLEERLAPLGVNINTLNPNHINIYGNGDGRLPELNSVPRTDDLAKNAIQIIGGADGSFDIGDYILFYAWGSNRTSTSGGELTQDRNTYSNISCYFINVNTAEVPLRVAPIPNSNDPVTHSLSSYSFFQKYETESTSLVKGGKRFYGNCSILNFRKPSLWEHQILTLQLLHLLMCFLRQMLGQVQVIFKAIL